MTYIYFHLNTRDGREFTFFTANLLFFSFYFHQNSYSFTICRFSSCSLQLRTLAPIIIKLLGLWHPTAKESCLRPGYLVPFSLKVEFSGLTSWRPWIIASSQNLLVSVYIALFCYFLGLSSSVTFECDSSASRQVLLWHCFTVIAVGPDLTKV